MLLVKKSSREWYGRCRKGLSWKRREPIMLLKSLVTRYILSLLLFSIFLFDTYIYLFLSAGITLFSARGFFKKIKIVSNYYSFTLHQMKWDIWLGSAGSIPAGESLLDFVFRNFIYRRKSPPSSFFSLFNIEHQHTSYIPLILLAYKFTTWSTTCSIYTCPHPVLLR